MTQVSRLSAEVVNRRFEAGEQRELELTGKYVVISVKSKIKAHFCTLG